MDQKDLMNDEIDFAELEKFQQQIDALTSKIESGEIKANPLQDIKAPLNREHFAVAENALANNTTPAVKENEVVEKVEVKEPVGRSIIDLAKPKENAVFDATTMGVNEIMIHGKVFTVQEGILLGETKRDMGIRTVITSPTGVKAIFISAAACSTLIGLHPTTIRTRMDTADYKDEYGNTWEKVIVDLNPVAPINADPEQQAPNNSFVYSDPEGGSNE